jgi:cell division ATPase FtsA
VDAGRESWRILSKILQPGAEEIVHLLWDEIRRAGDERNPFWIVLNGGGAILGRHARNCGRSSICRFAAGCPTGVGGLVHHAGVPDQRRHGLCKVPAFRSRNGV